MFFKNPNCDKRKGQEYKDKFFLRFPYSPDIFRKPEQEKIAVVLPALCAGVFTLVLPPIDERSSIPVLRSSAGFSQIFPMRRNCFFPNQTAFQPARKIFFQAG